jgi:DNA-directed RNA polymerase specialized sigma24 family protein
VSDSAEAALAATFREEWPRLVAATMWIVSDLQAAEDVVQETFVGAIDLVGNDVERRYLADARRRLSAAN